MRLFVVRADEDDDVGTLVRLLYPLVTAQVHLWLLKHVQNDVETTRRVQISGEMPVERGKRQSEFQSSKSLVLLACNCSIMCQTLAVFQL